MKLLSVYVSIIFLIILDSMAMATNLDTNQLSSTKFNIEAIAPGHPVFQLIEEAIDSIFLNEPLRPTMCSLFGNEDSISITFGISIKKSIEIYQSCQAEFNYPEARALAKIFTRKYFLIEDSNNLLPFESWTNYKNETFLVINQQTSKNDLQRLLLHEIAISMDAKTNILLSGFFMQEGQHSSQNGNSILVMMPSSEEMTKQEMDLKQALEYSTNANVSMTFATMRALAIESVADYGISDWYRANTHEQCVRRFNEIYSKVLQINSILLKDDKSMQGLLASYLEKNIHISDDQIIHLILDADLKVPRPEVKRSWWGSLFSNPSNTNMTFCQYMAYPKLSSKSVYSFYSFGPRPRIGGGWSAANMLKNPDNNGIKPPLSNQSILKNIPPAGVDQILQKVKPQQAGQGANPNASHIDFNSLLNRMKSSQ